MTRPRAERVPAIGRYVAIVAAAVVQFGTGAAAPGIPAVDVVLAHTSSVYVADFDFVGPAVIAPADVDRNKVHLMVVDDRQHVVLSAEHFRAELPPTVATERWGSRLELVFRADAVPPAPGMYRVDARFDPGAIVRDGVAAMPIVSGTTNFYVARPPDRVPVLAPGQEFLVAAAESTTSADPTQTTPESYYLGKPKIDRIVVRFVPRLTTRAVMLKTGELDLASLDRDAYRQIAGAPNVAFAVAPDHGTSMFFLNVTRPYLRDVRVRRAIAFALDRSAIVRSAAFNDDVSQLANGYADPLLFAYDRALKPLPYDPRAAAQLLDAVGWHPGSDGIRVRNGERLSLQIAANAGSSFDNAIDIQAQAMLRAVGIEADLKTYSPELIFAPAASHGVLADGTFDLFYSTYGNAADPDTSWILTCARVEPHGYNESRYCNPEIDRLEAAALATYDTARRARYYAHIDQVLARDVPIVFVAWPKAVFGMNPRLKGFTYNGLLTKWNAHAWSM